MFGIVQLIRVHSMVLCIVSDIGHKRWVGILIVRNVDMGSALDARGDRGGFLAALERLETGNVDVMLLHTLS